MRFEQETVWFSQAQMMDLFGRDQSVISRHIANAISDEQVPLKKDASQFKKRPLKDYLEY